MHKLQITALLLASLALTVTAQNTPPVPYPEGFREWVHVKTGLIGRASPSHAMAGGFHHIYANPAALRGLETRKFAEGSVIVFDRIDAQVSPGETREGSRLSVDVMVRDSVRFAATGGWGYERFRGDTRQRVVADKASASCFACHQEQKSRGYVFSDFRK